MEQAVKELINFYSSNPISRHYINLLFSELSQEEQLKLGELVNLNFQRYLDLNNDETKDFSLKGSFSYMTEISPFFIPGICQDLVFANKNYNIRRFLMVADIAKRVSKVNNNDKISDFFFNISNKKESETNKNLVSVLVKDEIQKLISNPLKLATTYDLNQLIENFYYLSGIKQVFLKYFFDLLCLAPEDESVKELDSSMRDVLSHYNLLEVEYWQSYKSEKQLKKKLANIIQKDSSLNRHKYLRDHDFNLIKAYNPIIHDGSVRKLNHFSQRLFHDQIDSLGERSLFSLKIFFELITDYNDSRYTLYLLLELVRRNQDKFSQFNSYLETEASRSDLFGLVQMIAKKVRGNADSNEVKKNNLPRKKLPFGFDKINSSNVAAYLEFWLKALYKEAKIGSALTQDMIPAYLAKFIEQSSGVLDSTKPSKEKINSFIANTKKITMGLLDKKYFSPGEQKKHGLPIFKMLHEISGAGAEKRNENIGDIGVCLAKITVIKEKKTFQKISEELLNIKFKINHKHKNYESTIKKFLDLPVVSSDKAKFIKSYIIDQLSEEQKKKIEHYKIDAEGDITKSRIFEGSLLNGEKLIKLLNPDLSNEWMLIKSIPVDFTQKKRLISPKDFFSLPLASRTGPEGENHFDFHLRYLSFLLKKKLISNEDYEQLKNSTELFPKLSYKRYFEIFSQDRFDEATFSAMIDLFFNDALSRLLIEKKD